MPGSTDAADKDAPSRAAGFLDKAGTDEISLNAQKPDPEKDADITVG
jgi:hypothetical protein